MAMPSYFWLFHENPAVQNLFMMGLVELLGLTFRGQREKCCLHTRDVDSSRGKHRGETLAPAPAETG